jgi:dual specificity phosphatase 12
MTLFAYRISQLMLPFPAREQVWFNPGFQEQLTLFALCQYAPSPSCGIYATWRAKIERTLKGL